MLTIAKNTGVILLLLLLHLYFYHSEHIKKFDYEFYDFLTIHADKIQKEKECLSTVIINIDEKSLQHLGQWPWPRIIDTKIIDMANRMGSSAIGLNIIFPEADRVSPNSIKKFYKNFFNLDIAFNNFPDELKDNDKLLSESIKNSNTTLSIHFNNSDYTALNCQKLVYKVNIFSDMRNNFNSTSMLCNDNQIQSKVDNFGFINAWRDSDGIFRRIPLFMNYKENTFPSFALATLSSFNKHIDLKGNNSTILINFSQKKPKIFSAIDFLNNKVSPTEIKDKIVIIGSSIVGINPFYLNSKGEKISNNMIQAFTIENILNNSFFIQPEIYKKINLLLSFLFSIAIIVLFRKKSYLYIVALIFTITTLSFIWLIYSYMSGLYISIGYLWIPFLYFFIFMLGYHTRVLSKEQQEHEKLLIRQSKLASMGEMITLIAHQWRQPLSVINGIVLNMDSDYRKQKLSNQNDYDKKFNDNLNKVEDTTAYLSKTINDFTDFFSKNKESERFYIVDAITQSKQLSLISKNKRILMTYTSRENIEIVGYKSELIQSLLVIINNAIYACKKNLPHTNQGKITINTYVVKRDLYISIEDNGAGIESQNLKKIFDPYFTTKKKTHGTGLGLYILKLIVEDSMNGKVSASNSQNGAVFTIKIPINIEENSPIKTDKNSASFTTH